MREDDPRACDAGPTPVRYPTYIRWTGPGSCIVGLDEDGIHLTPPQRPLEEVEVLRLMSLLGDILTIREAGVAPVPEPGRRPAPEELAALDFNDRRRVAIQDAINHLKRDLKDDGEVPF